MTLINRLVSNNVYFFIILVWLIHQHGIVADQSLDGDEGSKDVSITSPEEETGKTSDIEHVDMEGLASTSAGNANKTSSPAHKIECRPIPEEEQIAMVKIVNGTELHDLLDIATSNATKRCTIVLFYYPWCIFSSKAAPHFNALGRLYPQIHVMALDAYASNGINMRFGLVGVPSILFFQNSKMVAKFNDSTPTIEGLVSFVHRLTGLNPKSANLGITEEDLAGPLSSTPEQRFDFVLILSWIFIICCCFHFFTQSSIYKRLAENIRNNWREAEQANHEHTD